MNGRKSKLLRRRAVNAVYDWYKTLVPEEQQAELTPDLAVQYTPTVSYWIEYHNRHDYKNMREYTSKQRHVSEGTQRWFYLQEKKYASR
jgi:malic enzyme